MSPQCPNQYQRHDEGGRTGHHICAVTDVQQDGMMMIQLQVTLSTLLGRLRVNIQNASRFIMATVGFERVLKVSRPT